MESELVIEPFLPRYWYMKSATSWNSFEFCTSSCFNFFELLAYVYDICTVCALFLSWFGYHALAPNFCSEFLGLWYLQFALSLNKVNKYQIWCDSTIVHGTDYETEYQVLFVFLTGFGTMYGLFTNGSVIQLV